MLGWIQEALNNQVICKWEALELHYHAMYGEIKEDGYVRVQTEQLEQAMQRILLWQHDETQMTMH